MPTSSSPAIELSALIVDDEERLRVLLTNVVGKMGCRVTTARSAEEATRLMTAQPREVMILDLNLPGMQGLDFLSIVRQKWPGTQVIILTGFGDLETAKQAIRFDVADFISKPFHLGDLEVALDRVRRRLAPAGPGAPGALPASAPNNLPGAPSGPEPILTGPTTIEDLEREAILAALRRHRGNRSAAAQELGISRRTLYNKLNTYGMSEDRDAQQPAGQE